MLPGGADRAQAGLTFQPVISGLSHITFVVNDLDKMARIIVEVLGGVEVYSSRGKTFSVSKEKFFMAGGLWIAIMEGRGHTEKSYNHVAFKIDAAKLSACRRAIETLGLDIREPRHRIDGEGQSIYFHDYDNHLFELHTGTLDERLAAYEKMG